MTPYTKPTYREWQPGDGLTCAAAKQAPPEIPCGKPTTTAVSVRDTGRGGPPCRSVRPLCANHARIGLPPSQIMVLAKKEAAERLVAAHWDEYRDYLTSAIARITRDADAEETETTP